MMFTFPHPLKIHDGDDFVATFQDTQDITQWLSKQHSWIVLVNALGQRARDRHIKSSATQITKKIAYFHDNVAAQLKQIENQNQPDTSKIEFAAKLAEGLSTAYKAAKSTSRDRLVPQDFIPIESEVGRAFEALYREPEQDLPVLDGLADDNHLRAEELVVALCLLYGVPLNAEIPQQHIYRATLDLISIRALVPLTRKVVFDHWKQAETSADETRSEYIQAIADSSDTELARYKEQSASEAQKSEEFRAAALREIEIAKESAVSLLQGEKEKKKLEWLRQLWEKRERNQTIAAFVFDFAFVVILGFTMIEIAMNYQTLAGVIVAYIPNAEGELLPNGNLDWSKVAPIAAVTFALVWLLRMLRQNALDLRAKAHTASTKVAMFKSYFRLVSDADTSPTPEERVLITEALFRDTEHAGTHDDGMPNTIATAIIDRLMRKPG